MTLPNLLIIGAAKAATTSLYHALRQHPDIYMSPVKEPAYFASEGTIRTRLEYERLFEGVRSERAIGEASPQYLNDRAAPARIAAELPDVRLIVSLRNPIDRAYSSYLGRIAGGSERRSVDDALQRGTYYVDSSLYHAPLVRYFSGFNRHRIKVVLFDDVVADMGAVLRDMCGFLEVEQEFAFDTTVTHGAAAAPRSMAANAAFMRVVHTIRHTLPSGMRNSGLAGRAQRLLLRTPEPLPIGIRQRLLADFSEDIRRTEALIGRSLSHWVE